MDNSTVIWTNCRLYTMETEDFDLKPFSAMIAKNGRVFWTGELDRLPKEAQDAQVIDCQGMVLTPGLIDCHTHLVYAGNRSHEFEKRLQGQSYQQIHQQGGGIQATVKATRAAQASDLFKQSAARLQRMIQHGTTCVEIKSGYGLNIETEAKMLRIAQQLAEKTQIPVHKTFLGAHALAPEFDDYESYLAFIIEDMLPSLVEQQLVDSVDIFCEHIAFTPEQCEALFKVAQQYQLPIKCHSDQLSNMGATQLAARYHAQSVDHLEYATQADVDALKHSGSVAVILPGAFYFLQETQKPPITQLRQAGVPMAIATDCNPGSSPTTSLPLMMNMACVLFGLTPQEAWLGVTRHAAHALQAEHRGMLAQGYHADCVLWDIEHPFDLVYAIGDNPCQRVYSQGRLIYERQNSNATH